MNPKVSVLMTVYNDEQSIVHSVKSILNQTYNNFEFIIVNDGSKDKTIELIKKIEDSRIVLVDRVENKGRVLSLNEGLTKCKTNYIFINDSDDISQRDRIEKTMAYYNNLSKKKQEKVGLISGISKMINSENQTEKIQKYRRDFFGFNKKSGIMTKAKVYCITDIVHSSVMFKKDALESIGNFPEEVEMFIDYLTIMKLSVNYDLHKINNYVVDRVVTGNNFFMTEKMHEKSSVNQIVVNKWEKQNIKNYWYYSIIKKSIRNISNIKRNFL